MKLAILDTYEVKMFMMYFV